MTGSRLKLHELESFLQVAVTGSFRRAAELLHRSPSAVSSHVRNLEEELDVALIERTTRRMALTAEGTLLRERCEQLLEGLESAAQEVREQAAQRKGRICVGVSPSVSHHHLLPVLESHEKAHPELTIELIEGFAENLYAQLASRRTDFAIGPGLAERADFHVRPILEDPIVALVPRNAPVDRAGAISLEEIATYPQVCMPRGTAIRAVIEQAFRAAKLPLRARYEVMYPHGLFDLVAEGAGVAMMPVLSLPPPRQRGFRTAPIRGVSLSREMCLITLKSRRLSPAARRLCEAIVQHLKSMARAKAGARE